MHGLIWWVIVGLVAGVLAKVLTPGSDKEPKGCIMTILLGIAGSVIVGFLMNLLLGGNTPSGMIGTIIGATIGAILLILGLRKFWK